MKNKDEVCLCHLRGTQKTSLEGDDHRIGGLERLSVHVHQPFYFTGYEAKAQSGYDLPKVTGPKAKTIS